MMTASAPRARFLQLALAQLGKPVLWGAKGPEAFDCSGLVAWSHFTAGGLPDLRAFYRAQSMADECAEVSDPQAGDLCFYGDGPNKIEHVAILLDGGRALSADGATSRITDLKIALANPSNRVRVHDSWRFRRDLPFAVVLRNSFVTSPAIILPPPTGAAP